MRSNGRLSAARLPTSTESCPARTRVAAPSRTISRRRRRTLLRSTAFPTLFDTVKPNRAGPWSRRLRACSTNAVDGAFIPDAAARKSARCLNRSMKAMRGLFAAVRRTTVCDHAPGARTRPYARPWSPYVRGSRGGAYVRACSVDRSASRLFSAGCALGKEGLTLDTPSDPLNRADVRFCAAYKGGPVVRQCRGIGASDGVK